LDPGAAVSPGAGRTPWGRILPDGTLSLYAALNTRTGEILGETVPRHTSAAFGDFLDDIVATQSRRREVRVIVDHLAAHKTKGVTAFLEAHPRVHLHFTPTYSSGPNQVELWFCEDRARSPCAGHLYVDPGPRAEDPSIHHAP
jgi:DDE superfamily endonuclease